MYVEYLKFFWNKMINVYTLFYFSNFTQHNIIIDIIIYLTVSSKEYHHFQL